MTRIGGATVAVDGAEVIIEFTGGPVGDVLENRCNTEYELEFNDQTTPITVTIWQLEPTVRPKPVGLAGAYGCNAIGYLRELRYPIVGDRPGEIIDGSNNETIAVILLTELFTPSVLPDGWAIQDTGAASEPSSRTTAISNGSGWVFLRTTLVADPETALDRFRAGSPQPQPAELRGDPLAPTVIPLSPLPFTGTVDSFTLRNGTDVLAEITDEGRRLRFVEGSYLYELSASLDVLTSVIMTIAEGLT